MFNTIPSLIVTVGLVGMILLYIDEVISLFKPRERKWLAIIGVALGSCLVFVLAFGLYLGIEMG